LVTSDQFACLSFNSALSDIDHSHSYGVGYGLERLAMLRYRIDDIRKVDVSSVA
jgi:phenylalanyl-tRNA synthetase alpha subunit